MIFNKEKLESTFRKNIEENLKSENSFNSESIRTRSKSKDPKVLDIKQVKKELVVNDDLFSCKINNIFSGQGKNNDEQESKAEKEKKVEIIDKENLNELVLKKRKEISLTDQTCSSSTTTGTKIENKVSCTNKTINKNPKISEKNTDWRKIIANLPPVKLFVVSGFRLLPEKIRKLEEVGLYLRVDNHYCFDYLILVNNSFNNLINKLFFLLQKSFGWTKKFMIAILKGKDILQIHYLDECLKEKKILPIENYTFKDEIAEKKYQFRLTDTIEKVKNQEIGVFDQTEFFIWENPALLNDVSEIIKTGGGIISEFILINTSQIILIKNSDKQNFENVSGKVNNIYSFDLVFMACIQQKIDLEIFSGWKLTLSWLLSLAGNSSWQLSATSGIGKKPRMIS